MGQEDETINFGVSRAGQVKGQRQTTPKLHGGGIIHEPLGPSFIVLKRFIQLVRSTT